MILAKEKLNWIQASDRYPENDDSVLVLFVKKQHIYAAIGRYTEDGWQGFDQKCEIVAWAPLWLETVQQL